MISYWNAANQHFSAPEPPTEPPDARMYRRGRNDADDWYEPVCCAGSEEDEDDG